MVWRRAVQELHFALLQQTAICSASDRTSASSSSSVLFSASIAH